MRKYKRKGPRQWRDKDKRMTLAVRMRAEGKSLREIGDALAVSYMTVARDLERWDRQHSTVENVVSLSQKLSQRAVTTDPQAGQGVTPECDTRTTGEALGLTVKEEAMTRAIASLVSSGGR